MPSQDITHRLHRLNAPATGRARVVALALLVLAGIGPARAAGQVEVRFAPQDQLSDIGRGLDGDRNLRTLDAHLQSLAHRLPDGQTLSIEVQDVDLAGELQPWPLGTEMRVLRGRADGPVLALRWTLTRDGQAQASASERLFDLTYLMRPLPVRRHGALAHELRLIDRWFDDRFGAAATR